MPESLASPAHRERLPRLTDRIPLGTTGLEVSRFCLGLTEDPKTVCAAFEAGINFFFLTADMHWPLYEGTRKGLRMLLEGNPSARDRIVVGACSYTTQPEFCWMPYQEVLEEVPALERLDLTIAGGSYGHEFPVRVEGYERQLREGWCGVRAIGATFHDRGAALTAMGKGRPDVAFVRYNPSHPGAQDDLFPHVVDRTRPHRPVLFGFKSTTGHLRSEADYEDLGVGKKLWRPRLTDYYRFALTQAALDGILCALGYPEHVGDLADAMERGPLAAAEQAYLINLGALVEGKAEVV